MTKVPAKGSLTLLALVSSILVSCTDRPISHDSESEESPSNGLNVVDRSNSDSPALESTFKTNEEIIGFASEAGRRYLDEHERESLVRAGKKGLSSAYYVLYLNESLHGSLTVSENWLLAGHQANEPNSLAILAGRKVSRAQKIRPSPERSQLLQTAKREFTDAKRNLDLLMVMTRETVIEEMARIDALLAEPQT